MAQLKTAIWVDALIRRAQVGGAFACVVQRGDKDAGSVLICVRSRDGLQLYTPERNMDGDRCWRAETLSETDLALRIEQRLDFDPDLMVVEIDDPQARHFIEEPVLDDGPKSPSEPLQASSPQARSPQEVGADAVAAAKALFQDR